MGHDVMKERKRSLREATNTLIVIISVYLVSNLLNLFLSTVEYVSPGENFFQFLRILYNHLTHSLFPVQKKISNGSMMRK